MDEFVELPLSGGKVEFKRESDGAFSATWRHSNPWAAGIFQLAVSYDGTILGIVPPRGIGQPIGAPQPSVLVWITSDRHGMYGKQCPACKSYFRMNGAPVVCGCPYCGVQAGGHQFLTANQREYVRAFCEAYLKALDEGVSVTIDLDEIVKQLPDNRPKWHYAEQKQQTTFKCKCKTTTDILGEYGICPSCGHSNFKSIFESKMDALASKFSEADATIKDRNAREVEWVNLTQCVSDFEAMANEVRKHLLPIPMTPKRREALGGLSFQALLKSQESILRWYGFDILEGVAEDDRSFLHRMFHRRHLFTHKGGRVDQEYLDNTGDGTVKLNQTVRVRSNEISRLIQLVKACGVRLATGFDSIE